MKSNYFITIAPHISNGTDARKIMLYVIIALLPTIATSIFAFGFNAIFQYSIAIFFAVFFEFLFRLVSKSKQTINDLSAIVTAILLAMNLPINIPYWAIIIGAFVAIVLSKMVFGGLGQNPFNPALVGRMFLLISFPSAMTSFSGPNGNIMNSIFVDTMTSATTLGYAKNIVQNSGVLPTLQNESWLGYFLYHPMSCLGEVSVLSVVLGGLFLLYKKIITWHIPTFFIGTVLFFTMLIWLMNPHTVLDPITQILSGGLFLGAIFMATDFSSSPKFVTGKIIFAICCGILTVLIRVYGGYPEGVGFAILIMNSTVPILDRYFRPKIFGA